MSIAHEEYIKGLRFAYDGAVAKADALEERGHWLEALETWDYVAWLEGIIGTEERLND